MPRTRADVYSESLDALSEAELQELLDAFNRRFKRLEDQYLAMIGKQLREIGKLAPSDVHRLEQIRKMNRNLSAIEHRIGNAVGMSEEDVDAILRACADQDARIAGEILGVKDTVRVQDNRYLEHILEAQRRETGGTMKNLSNTTVDNRYYRAAIDEAVQAAQSGVEDYNTAIRRVVREAGEHGLRIRESKDGTRTRVVDYESGHSRRLDTAARMNVLDGVRHLNQNIMNAVGEQFGANGVEIDAHMLCAEDHIPYQGLQYSNEEFEDIQDSLQRPFGEWNCRHSWHPIVLGISPRNYTDEQLEEMKTYSRERIEIDGRTKTRYEWSQEMRRVETAIRQQKDTANLAKSSGDKTLSDRCRANVLRLNKYYQQLSDKSGLKPQLNRTYVPGYRDVKSTNVLTNTSNSGTIITDSSSRRHRVTEESIKSVPRFDEFKTPETNKAVHDACVEILSGFLGKNGGKEDSISIRLSDMHQEHGEQDKGAVKPVAFNEPFIAVHNHPSNETFSLRDAYWMAVREHCKGIVAIGNNGESAYILLKNDNFDEQGFKQYYADALSDIEKHKHKDEFFRGAERYGLKYISRRTH